MRIMDYKEVFQLAHDEGIEMGMDEESSETYASNMVIEYFAALMDHSRDIMKEEKLQ